MFLVANRHPHQRTRHTGNNGARGRDGMNRGHSRNVRRYPIPTLAGLLTGTCLAGLGAQVDLSANTQPDPVAACTNLAALDTFPVTSTRITIARFNQPTALSATSILKG